MGRIIRKVCPTVQVEVIAVTVGQFVADYLDENGRIIQIIGKISINNSPQFGGVPAQAWGVGLPFLCNLQAPYESIGWGSATIPMITGEGACSKRTVLQTSHGVLLLTPIFITCRGVLLTHAPPHATSATTSFVSDIKSAYGAATIGTILGSILRFIVWTTIERVRLLNIFYSIFLLLVSVTFSFLFLV